MISRLSSRARAVEHLVRDVEPWRKDHNDALLASETAAWVAVFNEEVAANLVLVRNLLRKLQANRLPEIETVGEAIHYLLDTSCEFATNLAAALAEVHRLGHTVASAADFHSTRADLERTRQRVVRAWPRLDPERFASARAALEAGRCLDVEDCIRELQGQDTP